MIKEYSIELEKILLETMKQQVENSDDYYEKIQGDIKKNNKGIETSIISLFIILVPLILSTTFTSIICEILVILCFVYRILKKCYLKKIERDIEKNRLFIKHEMKFKSDVTKDMGVYRTMGIDTEMLIKKINVKREEIACLENPDIMTFPTINDIDEYSYDTVMELYDLIKRNENIETKKLVKKKGNYTKGLSEANR